MDKIIRAVTSDGFAKISVVSGRDMVETARKMHGLTPTASAALGRTMCATSILGDLLKEEKASVTVRVNGGGPIGTIMVVSDCHGFVRGYVDNPNVDLPLKNDGHLNVGGAVGTNGMFTVSRDLGLKEPYVGSTSLVSGEIAEDFAYYYVESEQVGAAAGLGVLVDTDLSIKYAGGFLVQLLPNAPDLFIKQIELNIATMGTVTEILDIGGPEEIIQRVLFGLDPKILSSDEVGYKCYCSRERVLQAIETMGKTALEEIFLSGENSEVCCQFCDKKYIFTHEEVGNLLK